MSAFVAVLEGIMQVLVKKSEGLLLMVIFAVLVWFVTSEWNDLNNRVTNLEVRMDKVEARLDKIEARLDKIEARLVKMEADIASLDKRLTIVEMKVDEMRADIKTILTFLTTKNK